MKVLRFAPSPTGHLHIGGVRTALINFLYARSQGGELILRIEDTDQSRSSHIMCSEIIEGLKWLRIEWDHGPFYQTSNFKKYRETAFKLLGEQKAYRCFCTTAQLEARRKQFEKDEGLYRYDRKCLKLKKNQIEKKLESNQPFVIRFLVRPGLTSYKDVIHKEMKIQHSEVEDFVLIKSDLSPTYHLSVVVDDKDMNITHVIRGDDHISNTFKQILLFKALDVHPPKYAHLPLILGEDKKKLSKRHGETSIIDFKNKGYLPEAIITYLSQLSWIPGDSKKIFILGELINQFNLSKLSKASPVFDYNKLKFLNNRAIQQKNSEDLYDLLIQRDTYQKNFTSIKKELVLSLIQLIKPRMKTLADFEKKFFIYLKGNLIYNEKDMEQLHITRETKANLGHLLKGLEKIDAFTKGSVETCLRECARVNGIEAAQLIHPSRFALTSENVSPSIFDVFEFFGKHESIRRLKNFIDFIDQQKVS
jgi:glutamyl-tRNA synthetase